MFKIGDYVVCPGQGHGVAQIIDIEERDLGVEKKSFYILKVVSNGMKLMVPNEVENSVRNLVSTDEVGEVYNLLKNHDVNVDNSTWNRRSRDYQEKIKTGSLLEIADVLRSLFLLKEKKNLSHGEKNTLKQCRELLAQEIALSGGMDKTQVNSSIDACFVSS